MKKVLNDTNAAKDKLEDLLGKIKALLLAEHGDGEYMEWGLNHPDFHDEAVERGFISYDKLDDLLVDAEKEIKDGGVA